MNSLERFCVYFISDKVLKDVIKKNKFDQIIGESFIEFILMKSCIFDIACISFAQLIKPINLKIFLMREIISDYPGQTLIN